MEYSWKLFKRFLKERGLFASYCCNFREQAEIRQQWISQKNVNSMLELNARDYVNYSFEWSRTREGHDFWSNIDSEWMRYYNDECTFV